MVNKIDLPQADPAAAAAEVARLVGESADSVLRISAKTGEGVEKVLDAVIERIPPPVGDPGIGARARLRLVVRPSRGRCLRSHGRLELLDPPAACMAAGTRFEAEELGFFSPDRNLHADARGGRSRLRRHRAQGRTLRVGDTLTGQDDPAASRSRATRT